MKIRIIHNLWWRSPKRFKTQLANSRLIDNVIHHEWKIEETKEGIPILRSIWKYFGVFPCTRLTILLMVEILTV